jgi:hypothetical protein
MKNVNQRLIELTIAFALCWIGTAILSGCSTVDQAQAYRIITGAE